MKRFRFAPKSINKTVDFVLPLLVRGVELLLPRGDHVLGNSLVEVVHGRDVLVLLAQRFKFLEVRQSLEIESLILHVLSSLLMYLTNEDLVLEALFIHLLLLDVDQALQLHTAELQVYDAEGVHSIAHA